MKRYIFLNNSREFILVEEWRVSFAPTERQKVLFNILPTFCPMGQVFQEIVFIAKVMGT